MEEEKIWSVLITKMSKKFHPSCIRNYEWLKANFWNVFFYISYATWVFQKWTDVRS